MDLSHIFDFLRQLQLHNSKEWMDAHRDQYQEARQTFIEVTARLLEGLSLEEEGLRGLDPKKCIFRINRDIRFSREKSPYKDNFGAALAEGGRQSGNPIYYLHLQPADESFIAGGLYHPPADTLAKVRQEIDYNSSELKAITTERAFQQYFGQIQGDTLKRAPKGYAPDHPNIALLKLKDYLVIHTLTDQEVTDGAFLEQALTVLRAMVPFIRYLSVAIS